MSSEISIVKQVGSSKMSKLTKARSAHDNPEPQRDWTSTTSRAARLAHCAHWVRKRERVQKAKVLTLAQCRVLVGRWYRCVPTRQHWQ